jgi:hypothetical protein
MTEGLWPLRFSLFIEGTLENPGNDVLHLTDGRAVADFGRRDVGERYFPELLEEWLADPTRWHTEFL